MKKGQITKEIMIHSAIELFEIEEYEKVTFSKIAKRIGITQPSLYSYFKNKADLYISCSLYAASIGRDYIDKNIIEGAPAIKRFESYIKSNLKWVIDQKKMAGILLGLYYFANTNPALRQIFKEINEIGITRISNYLKYGEYEKAWKIKKINSTAETIHSLLMGEMIKIFHIGSIKYFRSREKEVFSDILKIIQTE